jgi:hypothetical protein
LADDLSLLEASIEMLPAALDWTWHQFTATAPERAAYAQLYVSVEGDSEVWFDDYAFVREGDANLIQFCGGAGEKPRASP